MDMWNTFVFILSLTCFSTALRSDFYEGSGGSGDGETSAPPTSTAPTTGPPWEEERVTMILYDVGNDTQSLVDTLQVSVAKYVELYCNENGGECVPESQSQQTVESIAFGQAAEDETFLSVGSQLFDKKNTHGVVETHHYRVMQDNVTVDQCNNYWWCCRKEGVRIKNQTVVENNLRVEYYIRATFNSGWIIVPQIAVEATLVEYEANITQDLGVEFDFIPDDDGENGGGDGEDDGEVLEPWAISLIVVAGVAVIGGIGYLIFKKQSSKKKKRNSGAYLDNHSRPNTYSSESNLYNTPRQRSSYGSAPTSASASTYKYQNPTYDKTDEKRGKESYQDVDLEAASSDDEVRTSL